MKLAFWLECSDSSLVDAAVRVVERAAAAASSLPGLLSPLPVSISPFGLPRM